MSEGLKHDAKKIRMDLLPFEALEAVAEVLTFGAKKHSSDYGWKTVDCAESKNSAALLRHLIAVQRGERFDAESGLLSAAHMAARALFILWFEIQKRKKENENKNPDANR